jgi:hypothetical protein
MPDDLDAILQLVASGNLSPEEAEPLIAAATARSAGSVEPPADVPSDSESQSLDQMVEERVHLRLQEKFGFGDSPKGTQRAQRIVRLQVLEGGKSVVNLRIPVTWAGLAGNVLPGISGQHADRIREAIRSGTVGRILEVQDEDGDGVIISTE